MPADLSRALLDFTTRLDALESQLDGKATDFALRRFVHSSRGMASAPFLVTTALAGTATRYCLYYRCHAWLLGLGADPEEIVDEVLGNAPLSPMQPRLPSLPIDFISVTVGAQLPIALGIAFAGRPVVAVFGDGALSTGVVFETLNIAAIHRSDILFVLDDNGRAVSTPASRVSRADVGELCGALDLDYHCVQASDTDSFEGAVEWVNASRKAPRLLHVRSSPVDQHSFASPSADVRR